MGLLVAQNFTALGGNVLMCDVNEEALTNLQQLRSLCSARPRPFVTIWNKNQEAEASWFLQFMKYGFSALKT